MTLWEELATYTPAASSSASVSLLKNIPVLTHPFVLHEHITSINATNSYVFVLTLENASTH